MAEESITITVSGKENVDWIRSKVRDGEFGSEAEVVTQGIASLREDDAEERDRWEREILLPSYERFIADPSSAVPIEEVERRLAAARLQRSTGR